MENYLRKAVWLALLLPLAVTPAAAAELSQKDIAAIGAAHDTYVKTSLAGDWESWIKLMTDDAVFCPPNQAPLEGRAALLAWVRAFPKLVTFTVTTQEVHGTPDLAYARGIYSYTAAPAQGAPVSERGSFLELWQRQRDGTWRMIRDMWHSNDVAPK